MTVATLRIVARPRAWSVECSCGATVRAPGVTELVIRLGHHINEAHR